jgi:Tol biopolymer transport system component
MEINKNYANELTVGTQFFENIPGGDYAGEIYVMNADGTGQTNISNNPAFDHGPSWSPDGTKIAFTRNGQIYVMNADGSEQTNISGGRFGIDPDWGPAVDTD